MADCYVPVDRVLQFSRSAFVSVVRARDGRGYRPRPDARVICRHGQWMAIVSFPPRRHETASSSVFLPLDADPRPGAAE